MANELPGYLLVLTWPISGTGGVNEVVLALAEQVKARGYRPVIAIATWNGDAQPEMFQGIRVVSLRLREPASPDGKISHMPGFLRTLVPDIRAFRRLLKREGVAVVNAHFPNLESIVPALLKAVKILNIPYVLSFHGADVVPMVNSIGMGRRLWQFILGQADAVTACSAALAREIVAFEPRVQPFAIHNGVNAELFGAPIRQDSRVILSIGKFEHKKGQDVLLKAFRKLVDAGVDAKLMLVGGEGPRLEAVRNLIRDLRLGERVDLRVNVPHEQVPALMSEARIFVLPSRIEPFGIVLLEAGAAGLPVIATSVGGIPELIENESSGLLIPADDEDALLRSIRRLWDDPALAQSLATRWHERVLANWSWQETAAKYLQAAGL